MLGKIIENWELITGTVASIAAFFMGKRGKKNEDDSGFLDNIKKAREIEKELWLDIQSTIVELTDEKNKLEVELLEVRSSLRACEESKCKDCR